MTPALRIYAGPQARKHIEQQGLRPQDVGVVPAAAAAASRQLADEFAQWCALEPARQLARVEPLG